MDGYTMNKPDIFHRGLIAARWIKDKAPEFTATFVMFTALWVIVSVCVLNLYYFDMTFYGRQAPPSMSVFSFQAIGFVFRSSAVFLLPAVVWAKFKRSLGTSKSSTDD